jgi:hypothetical protein
MLYIALVAMGFGWKGHDLVLCTLSSPSLAHF